MAKESKYKIGLMKTKVSFWSKLKTLFTGKVDDSFFYELENILISADISCSAVTDIVESLRDYSVNEGIKDTEKLKDKLKEGIIDILDENGELEIMFPAVIMIVGVNGVGKTTTIGKLVNYFVEQGKEVVVAAADTFRAAAKEQLALWAQRSSVRIINSEQGADPSSVVFDAITSAKAKKTDVLIIDTAGRLHNKTNLMEELKKMNRVLEREYVFANIYKLIVIDAVTGQNALQQVESFNSAINLDGVIITKLDGTAKGGIAVTVSKEHALPICFVGLGEGIDDLQEFNSNEFVSALFE